MKELKAATLIEKAITQVPDFAEINNKLERKVKLNNLSRSTYYNYARWRLRACMERFSATIR